jgi:hypothetical protein
VPPGHDGAASSITLQMESYCRLVKGRSIKRVKHDDDTDDALDDDDCKGKEVNSCWTTVLLLLLDFPSP